MHKTTLNLRLCSAIAICASLPYLAMSTGCMAYGGPKGSAGQDAKAGAAHRLMALEILGKDFSVAVSALGEPTSFKYFEGKPPSTAGPEHRPVPGQPAYSETKFAAEGVDSVTCSFQKDGKPPTSLDDLRAGGYRCEDIDVAFKSRPKDWKEALRLAGLNPVGAKQVAGFTVTQSEIVGIHGLGKQFLVLYGGDDTMGFGLQIGKRSAEAEFPQ